MCPWRLHYEPYSAPNLWSLTGRFQPGFISSTSTKACCYIIYSRFGTLRCLYDIFIKCIIVALCITHNKITQHVSKRFFHHCLFHCILVEETVEPPWVTPKSPTLCHTKLFFSCFCYYTLDCIFQMHVLELYVSVTLEKPQHLPHPRFKIASLAFYSVYFSCTIEPLSKLNHPETKRLNGVCYDRL